MYLVRYTSRASGLLGVVDTVWQCPEWFISEGEANAERDRLNRIGWTAWTIKATQA